MNDKFEPYRQKAKEACKDDIKKFLAINKSFFLSRLGKKEMDLLKKDYEFTRTVTISKLMKSLSIKEHFEIRDLIVDGGEIRSLPDFFKSCLH
ncbi:hypothetical protein [Campylobacter sp. FOBRC14]|uniref:hypothetical protein n=1 Tax=Campylobacter sp. FOBRC14 TaxID=936554 RepID=UPI00027A387E|nr:hypothetical protein [Campylobacter sp. FOBRC14]EJP74483.1 hypothetical protein HMPREF1139_1280 [Campylobacter sp. FOBRC14]